MDPTIIVAIVTAIATILVAVITGMYAFRQQKKKVEGEQPNQSITAGGHAIMASGQATQNINIGVQVPKKQNELVALVETILDSTNSMLAENQLILSPLFNPRPDIRSIGNDFGDLYNNQRHRGDFGKWLSYLKILQEKEMDSKVKEQIERLHAVLYELHRSFYKSPEQREINHLVGEYKSKILLIDYINARIPIQQMRTATQKYLDFLRDSIEQIGNIAGVLRALNNE